MVTNENVTFADNCMHHTDLEPSGIYQSTFFTMYYQEDVLFSDYTQIHGTINAKFLGRIRKQPYHNGLNYLKQELSVASKKPSVREYLDEENRVIFACPACDKKKAMRISTGRETRLAPYICCRCSCGHPFNVVLERRRHPRKSVNLPGRYMNLHRNEQGEVTILDISRAGVQMEFNMPSSLDKGNLIFVEFQLDDNHRSLIHREIEICSVSGTRMGGNFTTEDHQDLLKAYLEEQGLITEKDSQILIDASKVDSKFHGRHWEELLSIFS